MNGWVRTKRQNGFTVIELLIVIIVIGILVALIFVGYGAITQNATNSVLRDDISKFADTIKLKALDNKSIPNGGATAALAGDSTLLPGVKFAPNKDAYDQSVSNLYYCTGLLNGSKEFGIAARSKTGKAYAYLSNKGVSDFGFTGWSQATSGVALCNALGFSDPFTWSYGYSPLPQYGWWLWTYNGEIITNYATNPSAEASAGWISNNAGLYPVAYDTAVKRSGARSLSGSSTSPSTVLLSTYALGAPDGNGNVISGGGEYTGSVYFRGEVANQGRLAVAYRDGGVWSSQTVSSYVTGSTSDWTRVSLTITVPGTADRIRFALGVDALSSAAAGTKGYADDFMLTKGSTIRNYADGTSSNWSWTGTANASTSTGPPK